MGISLVVGIIGAVASAAGTMQQAKAQKKAQRRADESRRRAQQERAKAQQIERQKQEREDAIRRREALRETLRRRAQVVSGAALSGAGLGSSGVQGALGQVAGQGAAAVSNIQAGAAFAQQQSQHLTAAGQHEFAGQQALARGQQQASMWQGVGSIGTAAFQNRQQISDIYQGVFK